MYRLFPLFVLVVVTVLPAVMIGCGSETAPTATKPSGVKEEIPKGLTELSPEDRALAIAKKVCPVSGERLGSMGAPFKTTVKGQTVFLCCDGCEEAIKKDPDKYLAKLNRHEKK